MTSTLNKILLFQDAHFKGIASLLAVLLKVNCFAKIKEKRMCIVCQQSHFLVSNKKDDFSSSSLQLCLISAV
jgi:hypothetical protein